MAVNTWQSHQHNVGDRVFVVLERNEIAVLAGDYPKWWREVQDGRTGEVIRRFDCPQNSSLPPYDFSEGQQWLEAYEQRRKSMATGSIMYTSGSSNINISSGTNTYVNPSLPPLDIPVRATYIAEARYGGTCFYCARDIAIDSPIWWYRDEQQMRSRIWCGSHKTQTATAVEEDYEEDDDMAQRMEFRFPYTGTQIAAGLEAQAAAVDAKIGALAALDSATLEAVFPTKAARETFLAKQDASREGAEAEAARYRKEAVPFTQAGSLKFDLDLEDIGHYGLDIADVPRKAPRKRKSPTRDVVLTGA